jgi:ribonuclease HI
VKTLLPPEDLSRIFDYEPTPAPATPPPVPAVQVDSLASPEPVFLTEAYTDGGCRGNPGKAGYGVVVYHRGQTVTLKGVLPGLATNNEAEYAGLLACLRWALQVKASPLLVHMDSELVVRQMQGRYGVGPKLRPLYLNACDLVLRIGQVTFQHVMRERNGYADRLANEAMDQAGFPREQRVWRRR